MRLDHEPVYLTPSAFCSININSISRQAYVQALNKFNQTIKMAITGRDNITVYVDKDLRISEIICELSNISNGLQFIDILLLGNSVDSRACSVIPKVDIKFNDSDDINQVIKPTVLYLVVVNKNMGVAISPQGECNFIMNFNESVDETLADMRYIFNRAGIGLNRKRVCAR